MSIQFNKPENAIKRAEEMEAVGNKNASVELLFNCLQSKKHKIWSEMHEVLVMKLLSLCVELRNSLLAKETLHHYRNISQQQAPGSLEHVIKYFIQLAEDRTKEVRAKSDGSAIMTNVEDLDVGESPESLILQTITHDGTDERKERALVVPWLRFLWETYRTVLDILKNNAKLETTYHAVCKMAFAFCRQYERGTEFRRLCEILRHHLINIHKMQQVPSDEKRLWIKNNRVIWNTESAELHLHTRFDQLETASVLKMWTEGFRTVEDIHGIMEATALPPRPILMATYHEKLAEIFWVSENYLFHAYALKKYFTLCKQYNKKFVGEQMETMASCVLLAALSIPTYSATDDFKLDFSIEKEKNMRMATLLGFASDPTRESLLHELGKVGMKDMVAPELRDIYNFMEKQFHPLKMVQSLTTCFEYIKTKPALKKYLPQLEKLMVFRLLSQLSQVYKTVHLQTLLDLIHGLSLTWNQVEILIVRAVKNRQLSARIDHTLQIISFGDDQIESEKMRRQLSDLSKRLYFALKTVQPSIDSASPEHRNTFFSQVKSNVEDEHEKALARKDIIEKRKESYERMQVLRLQEEAAKKEEAAQAAAAQEAQRLEKEKRRREQEQKAKIDKQMIIKETIRTLKKLGQDVDSMNEQSIENVDREKLVKEGKEKAMKAMSDMERKMRDKSRKLDYRTRALREIEIEKIKAKEAEDNTAVLKLKVEAKKKFEEHKIVKKQEHDALLVEKSKLSRMMDEYKTRVNTMTAAAEDATKETKKKLALNKLKSALDKKDKTLKAKAKEEERKRKEDEAMKRKKEEPGATTKEPEKKTSLIPASVLAAANANASSAEAPHVPTWRTAAAAKMDANRIEAARPAGGDAPPSRFGGGDRRAEPTSERDAPPSRFGGDDRDAPSSSGWREAGGRSGDRDRDRDGPSRFGGDRDRDGPSRFGGGGADRDGGRFRGGDRDRDGPSRFGGGGDRDGLRGGDREGPRGGDREGPRGGDRFSSRDAAPSRDSAGPPKFGGGGGGGGWRDREAAKSGGGAPSNSRAGDKW